VPKGAEFSGSVTYNGDTANSGAFDVKRVASFVEQLDDHEPYLTVRETFQFAGACTVPVPGPEVRSLMRREE
jgi:ABC-type multidrug transport system ATPase subunit